MDKRARHLNRERLKHEAALGIYTRMEEEGISRAEFARRIGKSRPFVTRILEGSHNFTLETLADVYAALGRAVHLSLGDDYSEFRLPTDERKTETISVHILHEVPDHVTVPTSLDVPIELGVVERPLQISVAS